MPSVAAVRTTSGSLKSERLGRDRSHQIEERLVEDDTGVIDVPLVVELDAGDELVRERVAADRFDDLARAVDAGEDVAVHVPVQIARRQSRRIRQLVVGPALFQHPQHGDRL